MLTGVELLDNCRPAPEESGPTVYCLQFVGGLVQTLAALQAETPMEERVFCIEPQQTPLTTVTDEVTAWLEANSGRLNEPAFLLVSEALGDNYPCTIQQTDNN